MIIACFIEAGTVDDSIEELTRRVSTGASVVIWDFSNTAVNTSIRGHTLPDGCIVHIECACCLLEQ